MGIYLRKPKTVTAVKWDGKNEEEMHSLLKGCTSMWYRNEVTKTLIFDVWSEGYIKRLKIFDIVIKDEDGSIFIETDKCFNKNYELVEE
jgi:hypothetical protein